MFKYYIKLNASNIHDELMRFDVALCKACLSKENADFLAEQVHVAFALFQKQMMSTHTQNFTVDRLFEGKGYRVLISAQKKIRKKFSCQTF